MRIVTVCTGNLCRSPLIAQVLAARLAHLPALSEGHLQIDSAGTHAETGQHMPEPAARSSRSLGGDADGHTSAYLSEAKLGGASLIICAEREHRARVVALAPALLRRTFTIREFARLAATLREPEISAALDNPLVGQDPASRLGAVLGLLADARGMTAPPADPGEDDVVDPYRRSDKTYALAAEQMRPGIEAVAWVLALPMLWQD